MKYYSNLEIFKNSTGTNYFDHKTMKAYSYKHWLYFTNYKGFYFFNNTNYSNTTSKHQTALHTVLNNYFSINNWIEFNRTKLSLSNLENAILDEIRLIEVEINDLNNLINKKGTKEATNQKRKQLINNLKCEVKTFKNVLNNVIANDKIINFYRSIFMKIKMNKNQLLMLIKTYKTLFDLYIDFKNEDYLIEALEIRSTINKELLKRDSVLSISKPNIKIF